MSRIEELRPEVYAGYEWVAVVHTHEGTDALMSVVRTLEREGFDVRAPGTSSGRGGVLVAIHQAEKAREVIRRTSELKGRWVLVEDEAGTHGI